jgi:hypothetical protein
MGATMSETTTEPAVEAPAGTETTTTETTTTAADAGKDWQAEAEKWKAQSRKHEAEAKAGKTAKARLDEIEAANQTEAEKAAKRLADAETRANDAATRLANSTKENAILKAAAGKLEHPEDAVKFGIDALEVGEDGSVDPTAAGALVDQILTDRPSWALKGDGRPRGDVGQGVRDNPSTSDRADTALREGRTHESIQLKTASLFNK